MPDQSPDWRANYLVDGRWKGNHGIGRYSREILSRLQGFEHLEEGPAPSHPTDGLWTSWQIARRRPRAYFSPGYNAPIASVVPYAFTMHDLMHLNHAGPMGALKRLFYETVLKPVATRADRVITVSTYSKALLIEWLSVKPEKVVVIPNACAETFTDCGPRFDPGYPYILYVGNRKPHKNVPKMLEGFFASHASAQVKLLLTGEPDKQTVVLLKKLRLLEKVRFAGTVNDQSLPAFYRGAKALILTSLCEGFGLPILEAMACGTPVVTSTTTAMPEVAGESAITVDPTSSEAIRHGIDQVIFDANLRENLRIRGFSNVARFSWNRSAACVQTLLNEISKN